jgi:hypothetical protein
MKELNKYNNLKVGDKVNTSYFGKHVKGTITAIASGKFGRGGPLIFIDAGPIKNLVKHAKDLKGSKRGSRGKPKVKRVQKRKRRAK